MKYILVGVYVDEAYEDDVRKIKYSWSDYSCKFNLQLKYGERSEVKINSLLVIDLDCFTLVKLKVEDCIEILGELVTGNAIARDYGGFYYRYWIDLYPMLSEDSDSVILPNLGYEDELDSRKINSFCSIKLAIPAVYTPDREGYWSVDLFVNLITKSIAIGYDRFVLKEIQGKVENSDLINTSNLQNAYNIQIGDYLDLQDFGSHFVLLNNAIVYGDSSEKIISNGVESIVYMNYHENPHLDIVVPPSVKKICISYDRTAKKCSTTFMFSRSVDLSNIEFEFCNFTFINEAFSKLKTTLVDVVESELKGLGISIAYYG